MPENNQVSIFFIFEFRLRLHPLLFQIQPIITQSEIINNKTCHPFAIESNRLLPQNSQIASSVFIARQPFWNRHINTNIFAIYVPPVKIHFLEDY